MSDMGDTFNAWRDAKKELRRLFGQPCPVCVIKLPRANPTILLPQHVCRIHKYRDPRPDLTDAQYGEAGMEPSNE